jgi:proline dehydrogenase
MLLGVLAPLRKTIREAGHPVRVAVPYGPNWYPYSLRRLRKNPKIAGYVLKSLLKS